MPPEGFSQLPRSIMGGVQVQAVDMAANLLWRTKDIAFGTIATTGSGELLLYAPVTGTLINFRVGSSDGCVQSDTNYITFQAINKTNGGVVMASITTQVTGGNAIPVYGSASWVPSATPANLVVALNDLIAVTYAVTGTLSAAVHEVTITGRFQPS